MIIARPKQRRQKAPSFHGKGPQGKLADLPWCLRHDAFQSLVPAHPKTPRNWSQSSGNTPFARTWSPPGSTSVRPRRSNRRRLIVLDAGARQYGNALCPSQQRQSCLSCRETERHCAGEKIGDGGGGVVCCAVPGKRIMCKGKMHRSTRLSQHGSDAVTQPVIERSRARDSRREQQSALT